MQNFLQTVISQYGNSPTLLSLIQSLNLDIDPSNDIDTFYSYVIDLDTAQGFGLDVLGRIVGINRNITVKGNNVFFGFQDNGYQNYFAFNQAPFYVRGETLNGDSTVSLSDSAYRLLVAVKAAANISDCTAGNINKLLRALFVGRGSCYVIDNGGMEISYHFNFALTATELSILQNFNVIPRGAGVGITIVQPGDVDSFVDYEAIFDVIINRQIPTIYNGYFVDYETNYDLIINQIIPGV